MGKIGIVMGSISDMRVMEMAKEFLESINVPFEMDIVSAHRTPDKMFQYANNAIDNDISVIIAAAGGAAHLPGMLASITPLPVIGVPIHSVNSIDGWDSILSILQMPAGVPVATVALDGAKNAAILACQILGTSDKTILNKIITYKEKLKQKISQQSKEIKQ